MKALLSHLTIRPHPREAVRRVGWCDHSCRSMRKGILRRCVHAPAPEAKDAIESMQAYFVPASSEHLRLAAPSP